MNQKLLTALLRKNVDDLKLIADDFVESGETPAAIILLAQRKTEDIQLIISQLHPNEESETPVVAVEIVQEIEEEAEKKAKEEAKEEEEVKAEAEAEEVTETFETEEIAEENIEEIPDIEIVETPDIIEMPVIEEVIKTEMQSPVVTLADKMGQTLTPSRHEALYKTENSLGNTLGNKKVDDIKQAISIGDRFRFQRELFANNGEDMNKTLNYINQLATFDEAVVFLKSKYRWEDENEMVIDFLNLVKRKFI